MYSYVCTYICIHMSTLCVHTVCPTTIVCEIHAVSDCMASIV